MDITKLKANAEKRKEAANVCRSVAKTWNNMPMNQ